MTSGEVRGGMREPGGGEREVEGRLRRIGKGRGAEGERESLCKYGK